jgi:release factor glutamine methyltransferase
MYDRFVPELAERLAAAGFLSAREEAEQLQRAAGGDERLLASLAGRRLAGEPLAWIVGGAELCGLWVRVEVGVYVPRPHTEALALRAAERLPAGGIAVDVCTGSGAVAAVLADRRPGATVLATDVDERAVACARANGIDARAGDLFGPLPAALRGRVDVVSAVVPYVPTRELRSLQRDTFAFESALAYDGGPDGTAVLRRALAGAAAVLRAGGAALLELGGDQAGLLEPELDRLGFAAASVLADSDGDVRGIEAAWPAGASARVSS